MNTILRLGNRVHDLLNMTRRLDFLAPLLLRLTLAFVFIGAGLIKIRGFENQVMWFEHSLGMPFPALMVVLVTAAEFIGGILLLVGLATRYAAVPLMIAMIVAALAVHAENGWYAIGQSSPATNWAKPWAELGIPAAQRSLDKSEEIGRRVDMARSILREHGNYGWLTEKGNFVVLNNGIQFAAYYFMMLLVLFFHGGGRYVSADYWIARKWREHR